MLLGHPLHCLALLTHTHTHARRKHTLSAMLLPQLVLSSTFDQESSVAKPHIFYKPSRNKFWRPRRGTECWASKLTLTLGTARTAELSALCAGRTLAPRKFLGTKRTPGVLNALERCNLKISKNHNGSRSRNLPSCGAVLQSTAPPLTPAESYWSPLN